MVKLTVTYFSEVFGKQFGSNIESHLKCPITWPHIPTPRNYTKQIIEKEIKIKVMLKNKT